MAGSASNWFKVSAGPLKGQAVYLTKTQQHGFNRAQVLGALNKGKSSVVAKANTAMPKGVAKSHQKPASAPKPPPPPTKTASAPKPASAAPGTPDSVAKAKAKAQKKVEAFKAHLAGKETLKNLQAGGHPTKGVPVSNHLSMTNPELSKTVTTGVQAALEAINQVHTDGTLPKIPVKINESSSLNGEYSFFPDGVAYGIKLSRKGSHPAMTAAHEIGHFLDHQGLATPGHAATKTGHPIVAELMQRLADSPEIKTLTKVQQTGLVSVKGNPDKKYTAHEKDVAYLLSPQEQFARAYAQYIATRSQNRQIKSELAKSLRKQAKASVDYPRQWSPENFEPIAQAFDKLFKSKGWL